MLQGNFYTILTNQAEADEVNVLLELNPEHPIFEGHFPQIPVVPGVCMLQIVKELVEDAVGKSLRLLRADHLKFLSIINPHENRLLQVEIVIGSNAVEKFVVTASFFYAETIFFKFKGSFVVE